MPPPPYRPVSDPRCQPPCIRSPMPYIWHACPGAAYLHPDSTGDAPTPTNSEPAPMAPRFVWGSAPILAPTRLGTRPTPSNSEPTSMALTIRWRYAHIVPPSTLQRLHRYKPTAYFILLSSISSACRSMAPSHHSTYDHDPYKVMAALSRGKS